MQYSPEEVEMQIHLVTSILETIDADNQQRRFEQPEQSIRSVMSQKSVRKLRLKYPDQMDNTYNITTSIVKKSSIVSNSNQPVNTMGNDYGQSPHKSNDQYRYRDVDVMIQDSYGNRDVSDENAYQSRHRQNAKYGSQLRGSYVEKNNLNTSIEYD